MTRHCGGETVGTGYYWSLKTGKVVDVKQQSVLPGDGALRYYRMPFAVLFFLVIVFGGFYIVALPLIIAGTAVYFGSLRIFGGLLSQVRRSVFFGWRPSEAYLSGKKDKNGKNEKDRSAKE